jgi:hypothetical protein
MKLYEAFQDTGFHTTIMTTFCVEFDAFESIVLSRLRGAECRNVMLVCDADMLGLALADETNRPKLAGAKLPRDGSPGRRAITTVCNPRAFHCSETCLP